MIYYIVYKVTNKMNGKFYIGTHKTRNLDDHYMGSGKYLQRAIEKHGLKNFEKEILFIFDNSEDMYAKEAEIVNEDFLCDENTYNLKKGGFGGFDYCNTPSEIENRSWTWKTGVWPKAGTIALQKKLEDEDFKKLFSTKISIGMKEYHKNNPDAIKGNNNPFKGKSHSEETKQIISEKNSKHQSGKGNSQYGTRWIHSLEERKSRRIRKDESIPDGWKEGRKIKF